MVIDNWTTKGYYLKLNGCGDFQINTWTASNQYITHWLYFLKLKRDNIFGFCSSCVGNVIWNIRKLHITVSTRSRTNVHAWYVRVLFFCFFHTWFKHTVDISSPSTLFCLSLSGSRGGGGGVDQPDAGQTPLQIWQRQNISVQRCAS